MGLESLIVHTGPSAPPFTFSLLTAVDFGGTVRAIFRPVGAGNEYRFAFATLFTFPLMEQNRLQFFVQRQNSGSKVFANQRSGYALNADAWFPAIIKQQTIPIVIVAALMHQPLDGTKLLVGQARYWIFQSVSFRKFWAQKGRST